MRITTLNIGTRLFLGFSLICGLLLLIIGIATTILSHMNQAATSIAKDTMFKLESISDVASRINEEALAIGNSMLTDDESDRQALRVLTMQKRQEINTIYHALDPSAFDDKGRALLAHSREIDARWVAAQRTVLELLAVSDVAGARQALTKELRPALQAYKQVIGTQLLYQKSLALEAASEGQEKYQITRKLLIGLGLAAVAISSAAALWITKSITVPMTQALGIADTVASGNLTSDITAEGENEAGRLLAALHKMNENLAATVGAVRAGTATIKSASIQVANGNLELSGRTAQQTGLLVETAASMEKLTATVQENAENAQQAYTLAEAASSVAVRGGVVIQQVIGTMGEIDSSASKIGDIIGVIDGIAFQTNILALNAAVEAARAGEQDRGFAVVASEVRNLAQRSATAAREIKFLIDASTSKVQAGGKLVSEAGATMDEIVGSVRRVADMMAAISVASQQQTAGIAQISDAVSRMDNMTQQNIALVRQTSAASEAMREEADVLEGAVSVFKLRAALATERQSAPVQNLGLAHHA